MRRKNPLALPQPIGDILFAAFKKRGIPLRREESALFKAWPQAVGPQIACQTKPERLNAGTLFVQTTSSAWLHELHFMKEDIRQKLNHLTGKAAVRNIHFTVGYQPAATKDKTGIKKTALKAGDKKMIEESTAKLADPELAQIIKRVMEKEISRRRNLEKKTGR